MNRSFYITFVSLLLIGCGRVDTPSSVGTPIKIALNIELKGQADFVSFAAFLPDGKRVITVGEMFEETADEDKTKHALIVQLWNVESGEELQTTELKGHTERARVLSLSPDGKKVITGARGIQDRSVRIWNVESGKELQKLKGHAASVYSILFSPDGKKIVTTSDGYGAGNGTARIWDAESGKLLRKIDAHPYAAHSAAFSSDGKRIVTSGMNGYIHDLRSRVWDVETGKEVKGLIKYVSGGAQCATTDFSLDGKKIVTPSIDINGDNSTAHPPRIWILE